MKKLLYITIIAAGLAVSGLTSCNVVCKKGSGSKVTDTRKVDDFTKIEISGGYKVVLKQDSSLTVTVTTDDNLQKYIRTTVSGKTLTIKSRKSICPSGESTIIIGVRNLESISGSGAVEIASTDTIRTGDLDIHFSGAGHINIDLIARNVHSEGSGASEFVFRGQAASHNIEFSGTGKLDAFNFVVGSYTIETSGASESKVNVLNSLIVNASGASEVQYKGNPTTVKNHESGASSLKKVE